MVGLLDIDTPSKCLKHSCKNWTRENSSAGRRTLSTKKSSLSAKASTAVTWRSSRVLSSAACSTYENKVQSETGAANS